MNFKVSLNLPKLVRFKVGVTLGLEDGARFDVRVKLRGGRKWKWTAMADPGRHKKLDQKLDPKLHPKHQKSGSDDELALLGEADLDRVGQ